MHEAEVEQLVDRFFELLSVDKQTKQQKSEFNSIIHTLGLTASDLRDLAAQCRRRAIYIANTQ